jgi:aryl-alcohol dehydrogenase-like predicted oxidoreductase
MELRSLGKSKVNVTPVIFGAWAIGGWMWGGSDEKQAIEAIHASIDHGIQTIDTAPVYGMGMSEEIVGKAIKGKRDKVVIATKCGMRWDSEEGSDPWQSQDLQGNPLIIRRNLKPASIIHECEQSLKRLNIDVIDLYQIHWPDTTTPIEDSWDAMAKLKKQGKVRAIGVCNYSLEQLKRAQALHPVDSIQPPYSLIRRSIEEDIIPFCQTAKIGVIVYSPLERGLLTGKYKPDHIFPKGDHRGQKSIFSSPFVRQILSALSIIKPIADKHKATLPQVIINCTIHRSGITAALVGARNAAQAIENAAAATLALSEKEREMIAYALSSPNIQCPLHDA